MRDVRDLTAYHKACEQALRILEITSQFARGERHALTEQIGKMLDSMIATLAECWYSSRKAVP
jgi:hypothetical protein